jgi:hypothetical protein
MPRYKQRTLLILLAILPPLLAAASWTWRVGWRDYRIWRAWGKGRSYPASVDYIDNGR